MQQWVQATRACRCGRCDAVIATGTTMLEITLHQIRRTLHRCADCAGTPVPATVPATPASDHVTDREAVMTRIVPDWPWLREATRPVFAPDLVPVAETWQPFRDGDDDA